MEWQGEGTVIFCRAHGEHAAIIDLLSADLGRVSGLVPGGASRKRAAMLQPGNRVAGHWRARIEGQLGTLSVEPALARPGLMADGRALDGLNATASLLRYALPEHDPHPRLSEASEALWDAMDRGEDWAPRYVGWELTLLNELGFGLDLSCCALSGRTEGLAYVSPRSGRAVCASAAGEYAERLLALPQMLGGPPPEAGQSDLAVALRLTGHFLHDHLAPAIGRKLPPARDRVVRRLVGA